MRWELILAAGAASCADAGVCLLQLRGTAGAATAVLQTDAGTRTCKLQEVGQGPMCAIAGKLLYWNLIEAGMVEKAVGIPCGSDCCESVAAEATEQCKEPWPATCSHSWTRGPVTGMIVAGTTLGAQRGLAAADGPVRAVQTAIGNTFTGRRHFVFGGYALFCRADAPEPPALATAAPANTPAPTPPTAACVDAPDWTEAKDPRHTCAWYAGELADPDFACKDRTDAAADGSTAAEACCACGGGSAHTGVTERPPPVTECSAGIASCIAAKDASSRGYTYLICPASVEQKSTRNGKHYLLGQDPQLADGKLSYLEGETTYCPGDRKREIEVSFKCDTDVNVEVTEPSGCVYAATVHHPCACRS